MRRRALINAALVLVTMVLTSIFQPFQYLRSLAGTVEQTGCRQFAETGQSATEIPWSTDITDQND